MARQAAAATHPLRWALILNRVRLASVAYSSKDLLAFVNEDSCIIDCCFRSDSSFLNAVTSLLNAVASLDCAFKSICNLSLIDFNVLILFSNCVNSVSVIVYVGSSISEAEAVPGAKNSHQHSNSDKNSNSSFFVRWSKS